MKFVLSGGGTLGPVTPLLAVAEELQTAGHTCIWIGTTQGPERRLVVKEGIEFHAIPSGRLRRFWTWRHFADPFRIIAGFFAAYRLLRRIKPSAVLTAGGFVAVPVAYAAHIQKIPVLVHQQDVVWGLANKIMLRVAAAITVNFPATLRTVPAHYRKLLTLTGNPVRSFIKNARDEAFDRGTLCRKFNLDPALPTVLVLGGGTGALRLNKLMVQAAPALVRTAQILHVTGTGKAVRAEHLPHPERYHHYEFFTHEMKDALHLADVVVSRAGTGTIAELAMAGKPTILVPIQDSHQGENARYVKDEKAALVLDEAMLDGASFAQAINELVEDEDRRARLGSAIRAIANKDAAKDIAAIALKIIRA